ncbi:MAG: DUF1836 domain-containing protein [Lachnospiraceae bacterium]|nr:DUF1836 domain-containing protein [Lachnospiraceae bacterium]
MTNDQELVAAKLRRWKNYLLKFELPTWDNIPDIGLYMEQVIVLLKQYLDYLPPDLKEAQFITPATINNYVRMKVIPEPVKKRYYRIHIAYLIMVLTMKEGIEISLIRKLIPSDLEEDAMRIVYEDYATLHRKICKYFVELLSDVAAPILKHDEVGELTVDKADSLVSFSAVLSGFSHLLSEKLLLLEPGKENSTASED